MNYTQIVAAIADLIHRTDLATAIPTFINLAETQMRRNLRVRQMEIDLALTPIVDNKITLADDVVDVKSLWVPGFEGHPLDRMSFEVVLASGLTGSPTMYARKGTHDLFINGGGEVQGVVYQQIPALTVSAPENWLATEGPDVYIYGALIQCAIYTKADQSAYEGQYVNAITGLGGVDKRYTGRMRIRTR